jgi:hypothetical protein
VRGQQRLRSLCRRGDEHGCRPLSAAKRIIPIESQNASCDTRAEFVCSCCMLIAKPCRINHSNRFHESKFQKNPYYFVTSISLLPTVSGPVSRVNIAPSGDFGSFAIDAGQHFLLLSYVHAEGNGARIHITVLSHTTGHVLRSRIPLSTCVPNPLFIRPHFFASPLEFGHRTLLVSERLFRCFSVLFSFSNRVGFHSTTL